MIFASYTGRRQDARHARGLASACPCVAPSVITRAFA